MERHNWIIIILLVALLLAAAAGIHYAQQQHSSKPYSISVTIRQAAATSMAFSWQGEPADSAVLEVVKGKEARFGEADMLSFEAVASQLDWADGEPQGVFKAEAVGLEPDTFYTYRVGSTESGGFSEPSSFRTAAAAPSDFSFIYVTDSQGKTAEDFKLWGNTLAAAFSRYPDARLIVHGGDLTDDTEDPQTWSSFFAAASPWLSSVPLMPVTGNHEQIEDEASAFLAHFNLPDNHADGSLAGTNYSFDYENVHIAVLNTESNLEEQAQWLREDLAATDQEWKIVAMHRGLYGGKTYKKAAVFEEVIDEFEVDLVLQGHNHEYSRSYPLRGGKITGDGDSPVQNREGTVYIVANTAGPKFNEQKSDQFYHKVHFQNGKQMFAGITIKGNTLRYEAYDVDGEKLDEVLLLHP